MFGTRRVHYMKDASELWPRKHRKNKDHWNSEMKNSKFELKERSFSYFGTQMVYKTFLSQIKVSSCHHRPEFKSIDCIDQLSHNRSVNTYNMKLWINKFEENNHNILEASSIRPGEDASRRSLIGETAESIIVHLILSSLSLSLSSLRFLFLFRRITQSS